MNAPLFFLSDLCRKVGSSLVSKESKTPKPKRRWLRRLLWLCLVVIALGAAGLGYLNQVGLPGFAKRELQDRLAKRGIELDFDWVRLEWDGAWKAKWLRLGQADSSGKLSIAVEHVFIRPVYRSLLSGEPSLDELGLDGLGLGAELASDGTNLPPVTINWPKAGLHWGSTGSLKTKGLDGEVLGMQLGISLNVTNALALKGLANRIKGKPARDPTPKDPKPITPDSISKSLRPVKERLAGWLKRRDEIVITEQPSIQLAFRGDAKVPRSLSGEFTMKAEGVKTPAGAVGDFELGLKLNSSDSAESGANRLAGKIAVSNLKTDRSKLVDLSGAFSVPALGTNLLPAKIEYQVTTGEIESEQFNLKSGSLSGSANQLVSSPGYFSHQLNGTLQQIDLGQAQLASVRWGVTQVTNSIVEPMPNSAEVALQFGRVAIPKGSLEAAELNAIVTRTAAQAETDESWAYWSHLAPYQVTFNGLAKRLSDGKKLGIESVSLEGGWEVPRLVVNKFEARFDEGGATGSAELDIVTRLAKATNRTDFDFHKIIDLLTPKAQRWIRQYEWAEAPIVEATVKAKLPEWSNENPDWRKEVRPTMTIEGKVNSGPVTFRGIQVDAVESDLGYANLTWSLPNLVAKRPEGEVRFAMRSHTESQDFYFDFHSTIDPHAIQPALENERQKKGFAYFDFDQTPVIEGQIWGRWRERELTGFRASVAATNFMFRAQQVDRLTAGLMLTNGVLHATNAVLNRPEGKATLEALGYDVGTKRLFLTNAVGQLDPVAVTRAIGPRTARALEPYRFKEPPRTRVNGWVQTGPGRNPAGLRFEVDGGAFQFSKFNTLDINGDILWQGHTLTLTNVVSEFYGGELRGDLFAEFDENRSAEIDFHLETKQTELTGFMSDVLGRDSGLSGQVDGVLDIRAISNDWSSWNGTASAKLKDGYLWELPLFGMFSPLLDRMAPGLGASKFSEGTADFQIVDSIVKSRNLELKSPLVRLQYTGDVDFEGRISDAGVVAEALRDTWVIGPVLGPVLNLALSPIERMLKFNVTGTLNDPEMELKHIPKVLLVPVQLPFKLIDDLVPDGESNSPAPKKTD